MSFRFSKSKYCQLYICPKLLWLERNHPERKAEDPTASDRMETGTAVGELAKGYFGPYADMTVLKQEGGTNIPAMISKTKTAIADGVPVICEAAFSDGDLYCAVDILRKEEDGYAIYEVKSSTELKDIYIPDIAYQKYVLERCGVNVTGTYLLCINNEYVRGQDLDIQQLFRTEDVSDFVAEELPHIPTRLDEGRIVADSPTEPDRDIGCHCADPYECGYFAYCTRNLPKPSVLDLAATRTAALKLYEQGAVTFADAQRICKLKPKQERQIRHVVTGCGDEIDKNGIKEFLNTLSYPMYFLDFESVQTAIPQYPNSKPYSQIVFQYSLHYIETPGGELQHKEFLAESGPDPRRELAESLCLDLPMGSCVVVYNRAFERGRLKELAELFPDLESHLTDIYDNIADLLVPFRSGYYYNSRMGASFSIKSVLPALFPGDPTLDYTNLDGIHNGNEAMSVFPKIRYMSEKEAAEVRKSLLEYCKLDTYAMVKIWEKLTETVM